MRTSTYEDYIHELETASNASKDFFKKSSIENKINIYNLPESIYLLVKRFFNNDGVYRIDILSVSGKVLYQSISFDYDDGDKIITHAIFKPISTVKKSYQIVFHMRYYDDILTMHTDRINIYQMIGNLKEFYDFLSKLYFTNAPDKLFCTDEFSNLVNSINPNVLTSNVIKAPLHITEITHISDDCKIIIATCALLPHNAYIVGAITSDMIPEGVELSTGEDYIADIIFSKYITDSHNPFPVSCIILDINKIE